MLDAQRINDDAQLRALRNSSPHVVTYLQTAVKAFRALEVEVERAAKNYEVALAKKPQKQDCQKVSVGGTYFSWM